MAVFSNSRVAVHHIPGIEHRTIAGGQQGVRTMEVWKQTMAPGVATPVHRHPCEEVIVVMTGSGEVTVDGETTRFGPDSTLVVPPNAVHRIVNTSDDPMLLVAALSMSPVRVATADGERIPLPWDAEDK